MTENNRGAAANEDTAVTELSQILTLLEAFAFSVDLAYAVEPAASSQFQEDESASAPFQIGQFVGYCLLQAADAARSISRVARDGEGNLNLPIISMYPLARGLIECAATAIWAMSPADQRSRVLRRLQFAADELSHDAKLYKSMAIAFPPSQAQDILRATTQKRRDARAALRRIADAHEIALDQFENSCPGWETIVQLAGDQIPQMMTGALPSMWRLASGLSHPSSSRGRDTLDFTEIRETDGVLSGTYSVRVSNIAGVLAMAEWASRHALELWIGSKNPQP